jgi:hypothetical protein
MKPEHKATLLEIADAWDQCADEAEREAGKDEMEASSAGTIETIEVAAFTVPQSILFRADDVIER